MNDALLAKSLDEMIRRLRKEASPDEPVIVQSPRETTQACRTCSGRGLLVTGSVYGFPVERTPCPSCSVPNPAPPCEPGG